MRDCLFIVVSLFVVLVSCGMFSIVDEDYERIADKITSKTAKKFQEQFGLRCAGIGGGMMGDIYSMAMSFDYFQEVDLKEARELLVGITQEYLLDINTDKKVRPYLHSYPYTVKGVEMRVWCKSIDGRDVPLGEIRYFTNIEGVLEYSVRQTANGRSVTIHEETYEEALKIVEEQRSIEKKTAL